MLRERTFLEVTVKRSSLDQILITETSGVVPTQFRAHEYPEDPVAAIRYSPGYPIGETLPAGLIIGVGPAKFLVRFLPKTHRGFACATISIRVGVATPGAARRPDAEPDVLGKDLQGRLSPIFQATMGYMRTRHPVAEQEELLDLTGSARKSCL